MRPREALDQRPAGNEEVALCYHASSRTQLRSSAGSSPASVPPVGAALVAAGLLIAQQVAGKATRDAFFLSRFDVTSLPLVSAAAAILSLLAVLGFARGMARLSPFRIVPLAVAASAALLLGEWLLAGPLPRVAAVLVYLHVALFGATLVSGFWSLVNERFDPYSARRAVGPIGAGAGLGGMLGGLVTWGAAAHVSVPGMLVVMAILNLLCLWPLLRLRPAARSAARGTEAEIGKAGLRLILEVPYLRNLAIVVGGGAFCEALVDYSFNAAAAASRPREELMAFFALFHTAVGVLSLILQAALTRPSLARLGLAGTMAVQPAAVVLGSVLALSLPRLSSVVLLRGGQAVLRNSFFRSAYELLYTPLPQAWKRPSKVIVDVGFDRVGTAVGSGVVMIVLAMAPAGPMPILLAVAAASAGLILALTLRFHRRYVAALAESLRTGAVTLDPMDVVDATTRLTVDALERVRSAQATKAEAAAPPVPLDPLLAAITDLGSGDAERIRAILSRDGELDMRLVPHVIPLLERDDLFGDAVRSLRRVAGRCTGQLLDTLLDDTQHPVVRRRIPRVLKAVPTQRTADGLLIGLRDGRPDVRYRCTQALVRIKQQAPGIAMSRQDLIAAALRELDVQRPSGRSLDHVFSILSLALEKEPLDIALHALRSGDETLRGTALEYLENVLPEPVRERLWPQLGSPPQHAPSGRLTEELRDDLLRSTAGVARRRPESRRRVST